jgi:phosphate transport system permease protein
LQEYARKTRATTLIEINISNLAGVPSIVYGILGMAVFVRWFRLGEGVLAGALTLSLMVLPVVIVASREALVAIPSSIRAAAYALGATRWQVIRAHLLPNALAGILTGVILAVSRAIGEAAPLIMVGALGFVTFVPSRFDETFTALPIQIYSWCSEPQPVYHRLAAAAIIVLLGILIPFSATAIGVRAWRQKKRLW